MLKAQGRAQMIDSKIQWNPKQCDSRGLVRIEVFVHGGILGPVSRGSLMLGPRGETVDAKAVLIKARFHEAINCGKTRVMVPILSVVAAGMSQKDGKSDPGADAALVAIRRV